LPPAPGRGHGSDTGGSIRGPAAYNGIVGLKPTLLASRRGVFPPPHTLDHCGSLDAHRRGLRDPDRRSPPTTWTRLGRCTGPGLPRGARQALDGLTIGVIRHFHERDAEAAFGPDSAPSAAYVGAFDNACRTLRAWERASVDLQLSPLVDYLTPTG
jgi:aspartyl-tRNA(Asn)/glutamyl-tRNA(Gln) amidotransferase subunit A